MLHWRTTFARGCGAEEVREGLPSVKDGVARTTRMLEQSKMSAIPTIDEYVQGSSERTSSTQDIHRTTHDSETRHSLELYLCFRNPKPSTSTSKMSTTTTIITRAQLTIVTVNERSRTKNQKWEFRSKGPGVLARTYTGCPCISPTGSMVKDASRGVVLKLIGRLGLVRFQCCGTAGPEEWLCNTTSILRRKEMLLAYLNTRNNCLG